MPIVLTDKTNKVWAVEDPITNFLLTGYTGQAGPRLLDLLDFVAIRDKQFAKFVEKRREEEEKSAKQRRKRIVTKSADAQLPED